MAGTHCYRRRAFRAPVIPAGIMSHKSCVSNVETDRLARRGPFTAARGPFMSPMLTSSFISTDVFVLHRRAVQLLISRSHWNCICDLLKCFEALWSLLKLRFQMLIWTKRFWKWKSQQNEFLLTCCLNYFWSIYVNNLIMYYKIWSSLAYYSIQYNFLKTRKSFVSVLEPFTYILHFNIL